MREIQKATREQAGGVVGMVVTVVAVTVVVVELSGLEM